MIPIMDAIADILAQEAYSTFSRRIRPTRPDLPDFPAWTALPPLTRVAWRDVVRAVITKWEEEPDA